MNKQKYCVYHCTGSGGSFLLKVIAAMLGIQLENKLDREHGDYHDSGLGDWRTPNDQVWQIGNYWFDHEVNTDATFFYVHDHHLYKRLLETITSMKTIAISHQDDDHTSITKQAIRKAWPNFWTQQEYDKWVNAGCDFPPYHEDNLKDPAVHDKLLEQLNFLTIKWWEDLDHSTVDHFIEYKTVMGLNNRSLAKELGSILQRPVTKQVEDLILEYQSRNKELYFNE